MALYSRSLCLERFIPAATHRTVRAMPMDSPYQRKVSSLISPQPTEICVRPHEGSFMKRRNNFLLVKEDSGSSFRNNGNDQQKIANLGAMTDLLRALVPELLVKSLPKNIVSHNILLRVAPSHFGELNAYLPNIRGPVTYYSTCKALQLILTSVILSPKVKLHIQALRTSKNSDYECVYSESTKVFVRWSTCPEGCIHLSRQEGTILDKNNYHSTSDAKLGSHRWSRVDPARVLGQKSKIPTGTLPSITNTISQLTSGLIGLSKENKKLERIISGIFIFELNDNNDQIVVHTIEDVNVIEKPEAEDLDGELRVC